MFVNSLIVKLLKSPQPQRRGLGQSCNSQVEKKTPLLGQAGLRVMNCRECSTVANVGGCPLVLVLAVDLGFTLLEQPCASLLPGAQLSVPHLAGIYLL